MLSLLLDPGVLCAQEMNRLRAHAGTGIRPEVAVSAITSESSIQLGNKRFMAVAKDTSFS
jgi:hypothetical protein